MTVDSDNPDDNGRWIQAVLGLAIIVAIPVLVVSPWLLISIAFLFDAPGSSTNIIVYFLAVGVVAVPVIALAFLIIGVLGLLVSVRRWPRNAIGYARSVLIVAVTWLIYIGATIAALQIHCNGSFSCDREPYRTSPSAASGRLPNDVSRTTPPVRPVVREINRS